MAQKDTIRNKEGIHGNYEQHIFYIFVFISLLNVFFHLKQKMEKPPFLIYQRRGKVRLRNNKIQ